MSSMSRHRPPIIAQTNFQANRSRLADLDLKSKFGEIYRRNIWGNPESVSGLGSSISATDALRQGLHDVCREYSINSLLDAPCGDYGWMSSAKLPIQTYIGLDIVSDLIEANRTAFESENVHFETADLTRDSLPTVDLILCRDCLVHLSFENIHRVLRNIIQSRSRYLLTTTFPEHDQNSDIVDGDWRLLNLQRAPFLFPEPLRLINERCTEADGAYDDKSLGLWRIDSIPQL